MAKTHPKFTQPGKKGNAPVVQRELKRPRLVPGPKSVNVPSPSTPQPMPHPSVPRPVPMPIGTPSGVGSVADLASKIGSAAPAGGTIRTAPFKRPSGSTTVQAASPLKQQLPKELARGNPAAIRTINPDTARAMKSAQGGRSGMWTSPDQPAQKGWTKTDTVVNGMQFSERTGGAMMVPAVVKKTP